MTVSRFDNKVIIIVLAWNHKEDTGETLTTLLASNYDNFEIVLVDNASTDGTLEMMREQFPQVHVIASDKNLGVAGGYNLGMRYALDQDADFMLISNNDIQVHPDMLAKLVDFSRSDNQVGMVMPKIYQYYGDRTLLWCTGAHWREFPPAIIMSNHNAKEKKVGNLPKTIEYAPSCVLLLKREMVEEVGLFDTNYFFFFDDWDYSKRVGMAGYKIGLAASAIMWHKVSISTINSKKSEIWWQRMGWSAAVYSNKYLKAFNEVFFMVWIGLREFLTGHFDRGVNLYKGWRGYCRQEKP